MKLKTEKYGKEGIKFIKSLLFCNGVKFPAPPHEKDGLRLLKDKPLEYLTSDEKKQLVDYENAFNKINNFMISNNIIRTWFRYYDEQKSFTNLFFSFRQFIDKNGNFKDFFEPFGLISEKENVKKIKIVKDYETITKGFLMFKKTEKVCVCQHKEEYEVEENVYKAKFSKDFLDFDQSIKEDLESLGLEVENSKIVFVIRDKSNGLETALDIKDSVIVPNKIENAVTLKNNISGIKIDENSNTLIATRNNELDLAYIVLFKKSDLFDGKYIKNRCIDAYKKAFGVDLEEIY